MGKRVCVVGAGRWGRNHVATLNSLGCLGGIVESNEESLRELGEKYPDAVLLPSVDEALKQQFDGYVVATPAELHASITTRLLEAGNHVLVEKPMALTAKDAAMLRDVAWRKGVNLMVGHVMLFHPAIRKIKELIEAGKIGKLEYLYSNRLNLGTVRTEENVFWSFAPHDISIFQYIIEEHPVEILSRGGAFLQPHIHDTTMTMLRYPHNIVGHIFQSWLHPFKEHRLVVIGSKGMFSFEDASEEKNIYFYEKGIDWVRGEPIKRDGPTEIVPYQRGMPLTAELQYFIDHLDGKPIKISGADDAVRNIEILEAATRSLLSRDVPSAPAHAPAKAEKNYFVHPTSVVDEGVEIGSGTKIWHFSHVLKNAKIGENCTLGQNVSVGGGVRIGSHCKIQNNVSVYEGVELEDYVFCGPSMVFTNIMDPRCKYPQRGTQFYKKTLIREGASIGANATIVCGHTVGRHAFIAAGAVVTKDVPDYAMMMGVPARRVGWMCECGEKLLGKSGAMKCSRCGLEYEASGEHLAPLAKV